MTFRLREWVRWAPAVVALGAVACTIQTGAGGPSAPDAGPEPKQDVPAGGPSTGGAAAGDAGGDATTAPKKEPPSRSAADDADFTAALESVNETCGSKLTGRITSATLSVSYCSNLADGLRYVCQDNPGRADLLKAYSSVVCGDTAGPTAIVSDWGPTLAIDINETMSDPSERVRCTVAKSLAVTYKGDLDDKCLDRKH